MLFRHKGCDMLVVAAMQEVDRAVAGMVAQLEPRLRVAHTPLQEAGEAMAILLQLQADGAPCVASAQPIQLFLETLVRMAAVRLHCCGCSNGPDLALLGKRRCSCMPWIAFRPTPCFECSCLHLAPTAFLEAVHHVPSALSCGNAERPWSAARWSTAGHGGMRGCPRDFTAEPDPTS